MIILDSSIAAAVDLNAPRFGWHNLVTEANVTAAEEDADHPVENLARDSTALYWKGTTTGVPNRVTVDLGSAQDVDYLAIARHNFGSVTATYSIKYSQNDVSYTTLETDNPSDDSVIIHEFDTINARYWRIELVGGATAPLEIGVWYVGRILRMERRVYVGYTPFTLARTSTVSTGFSESGQFLGRVKRREIYNNPISFSNLTPAFVHGLHDFFDSIEERPFFFAWRPQAYPSEVGYCWTTGNPQKSNSGPNGDMDLSFNMSGIR